MAAVSDGPAAHMATLWRDPVFFRTAVCEGPPADLAIAQRDIGYFRAPVRDVPPTQLATTWREFVDIGEAVCWGPPARGDVVAGSCLIWLGRLGRPDHAARDFVTRARLSRRGRFRGPALQTVVFSPNLDTLLALCGEPPLPQRR